MTRLSSPSPLFLLTHTDQLSGTFKACAYRTLNGQFATDRCFGHFGSSTRVLVLQYPHPSIPSVSPRIIALAGIRLTTDKQVYSAHADQSWVVVRIGYLGDTPDCRNVPSMVSTFPYRFLLSPAVPARLPPPIPPFPPQTLAKTCCHPPQRPRRTRALVPVLRYVHL